MSWQVAMRWAQDLCLCLAATSLDLGSAPAHLRIPTTNSSQAPPWTFSCQLGRSWGLLACLPHPTQWLGAEGTVVACGP